MTGPVAAAIDRSTATFGASLDLGSGLHLHLDERWASYRPVGRRVSVALLGATVPADLESIVVRVGLPDGPVEHELSPAPHLVWEHLWSGLDRAGTPVAGSVAVPVRVGWKRRARRGLPRRTQWWDQDTVVGTWDARELGLGGLVPTGYHHLEADAGVLWSGNGQRSASVEIIPAAERGAFGLHRVPASADDDLVVTRRGIHIFDPKGRHRYTVDQVHHHEIFASRYDEYGRLAGWVVDGWSQYEVEHHHGEARIGAPGGGHAVVSLRDDLRVIGVSALGGGAVTFDVDAYGQVAAVTDPVGLRVDVDHDPDGRATALRWSTGTRIDTMNTPEAAGHSSRTITAAGREAAERRLSLPDGARQIRRRCCGSEAETVTTIRGDETLTIEPDGTHHHRFRHVDRTAERETTTDRVVSRTPQGRTHLVVRTRVEDADGTVRETLQQGSRTWQRHFDADTGSLTETSPAGRVTRFEVTDDDHQRWSRADAGTIEFERVNGLPVRITRGPVVKEVEYDPYGRVGAVTESGRRLEVRHDAAGRRIAEELATGWVTYEHDLAGRVVATTLPAGHTTRYERAADGLITAVVRATEEGEVIERFRYDDDRLLVASHIDGEPQWEQALDAAGRATEVSAGTTRIRTAWDAASGRPTRMVTEADDAVVHHYDGHLLLAEEAQGRVPGVVAYEYDADQLVSAVTIAETRLPVERDPDGKIVVFGPVRAVRSPDRGLVTQLLVGGLTTSYEHDATGALISHATYLGDTLIFAETITRGTRGEITTVVEHRAGPAGQTPASAVATNAITTNYTYDEAWRLARVERDGDVLLALTYDRGDNVVRYDRPGLSEVAEVGIGDRLRSFAGQATPHSPAGRIQRLAGRDLRYDGLGQVSEVVIDDGPTVSYRRDAKRRPIEITVDQQVEWQFLWSANRIAAAIRPDRRTWRCISLAEQVAPVALFDGTQTVRLVTDHRGSVRLVVDAATGEVLQDLRYDPLGRIEHDSNPGLQPFGYAGSLHDATTGLVHLGARELDVYTSRFLQPDPIGFEGGQPNLYLYAAGDPVNRHDPGGLQSSGTGTVEVCKVEVGSSAPSSTTSIDHGYIKWGDKRRGMTPVGKSPDGKTNTAWVDEDPALREPNEQCQEVENVDTECLDIYTNPGTYAGSYHPYNVCWDSVWDALDACSQPGKPWKWGKRREGDPYMPAAKGHQVGRRARRGLMETAGAVAEGAGKVAREVGNFIGDVFGD